MSEAWNVHATWHQRHARKQQLEVEQYGEWFFRTRTSGEGRWFAEAKRGPFVTMHAVTEPMQDDIYFTFADTREKALAKLKEEVWN